MEQRAVFNLTSKCKFRHRSEKKEKAGQVHFYIMVGANGHVIAIPKRSLRSLRGTGGSVTSEPSVMLLLQFSVLSGH